MIETKQRRSLRSIASRVGVAFGAFGLISLTIGGALHLTWSQPDANIGAGLFLFAGVLLFIIGLVVFLVSRLVGRR